jgi:hypothetical protein
MFGAACRASQSEDVPLPPHPISPTFSGLTFCACDVRTIGNPEIAVAATAPVARRLRRVILLPLFVLISALLLF